MNVAFGWERNVSGGWKRKAEGIDCEENHWMDEMEEQNSENSVMTVSSVEEMLRLLESRETLDFTKIRLGEEFTTIRIEVDGEGYGAYIPGEQLRTLWELQESFYRLAAFALYGTTDIRRLTQEERQLFELKVVTENGCWLGKVGTKQFWEELARKAIEKMDGRTIGVTILGCVALVAGYGGYDLYNHRIEVELQEKTKQVQQQEETRRIAVLADALKAKDAVFFDAMVGSMGVIVNELTERLAKRGYNASSISVGGKTYDREAIVAMNARAKSEPEEPLTVSGTFEVVELSKKMEQWSLQLRSETREDLTVCLSEDALDIDLAEAQRVINEAFYAGRKVTAVVVCGKRKNLLSNVKLIENEWK